MALPRLDNISMVQRSSKKKLAMMGRLGSDIGCGARGRENALSYVVLAAVVLLLVVHST